MPIKLKPYNQLSKSGKYYRDNPEAAKRKQKLDAKINKRKKQVKKRVESNKARRQARANGKNIEGKDFDHAVGRFVSVKKNRGRKGEGGRKKKR